MIKTKYLLGGIEDVPSMWVFGYYLKLPQQLSGQDMMIKSVFNSKDRTPSMSIYVARRSKTLQYRFYDHSTGYKGDKIDLVMRLFNLSYVMASEKILEEYNKYVLENGDDGIRDYKEHNKYRVVEWKRRKWNVLDQGYWQSYEIGSRDLERFQAWPLDWYRLNNTEKELIITGEYLYGYFTLSGELYKIYQPMVKDKRFMKVRNYIQGWDQLQEKSATCVISKSLKDIITLWNLGEWQAVSPDSENTLLPEKVIEDLRKRFQHLVVCFDNDPPGLLGMKKYEEKWGIPGIILPLEKDPSDSVKKYGSEKVAGVLRELITNKLTEIVT